MLNGLDFSMVERGHRPSLYRWTWSDVSCGDDVKDELALELEEAVDTILGQ